jgi:hypothetical protein
VEAIFKSSPGGFICLLKNFLCVLYISSYFILALHILSCVFFLLYSLCVELLNSSFASMHYSASRLLIYPTRLVIHSNSALIHISIHPFKHVCLYLIHKFLLLFLLHLLQVFFQCVLAHSSTSNLQKSCVPPGWNASVLCITHSHGSTCLMSNALIVHPLKKKDSIV